MKRAFLISLVLFSGAVATPVYADAKLLREAQRAYLAGDHEAAEMNFELVLAKDPKNVIAQNYLKQIRAAKAKAGPKQALERQLKSTMIPSIEFEKATLGSALDFLRGQLEKEGKVKTSFVLQRGVDPNTPVSLKLQQVPATEVMRYIGQLAKVRFQVEDYAIAVHPLGTAVESTGEAPVKED